MKLRHLFAVLISAMTVSSVAGANNVVLNQVGYLPAWPKTALLVNADKKLKNAEILNVSDKKSVFKITVSKEYKDPQTGDRLQTLNFTTFNKAGHYVLRAGNAESLPFAIGQDIYKEPLKLLLRSYYLQRCGVKIDDAATGLKHEACHLHDAVIKHDDATHKAGDAVASVGGWHDAGDYGKYVATTAITVGRILAVYEESPALFADFSLDIPESGNKLPDVLNEMKVGLDWMLTMQRADGAVYRKLSGETWPKNLTPDQDQQPRYIYGMTTPETAKAAAAWAMAARIYKQSRPEDAARYLAAAQKAWAYLETIEKQQFDFQEGDNKGSGPYMYNKTDNDISLTYDWDDRLWAAAELLITTGEEPYKRYVAAVLPTAPLTVFEWKDPSSMALAHVLFNPTMPDSGQWRAAVKNKILERAKSLQGNIAVSGYRIANNRFVWSSNKLTIEEGVILLYAYRLSNNTAYLNAAIEQLDYIFGRNHFKQSFVSGVGTQPVTNVSHLFLSAAHTKLAGLLVGGPNELEQSGIGPKNLGPLSYVDDARSYATNEYAIDLNASLIGLLGLLLSTPYPTGL
ncbi:MAG: glycoside hydrolase family 9 protein [Methylococcales bacterium]|nr:glycoside hydrolase family 9 protein [Methylococcales bacterium]